MPRPQHAPVPRARASHPDRCAVRAPLRCGSNSQRRILSTAVSHPSSPTKEPHAAADASAADAASVASDAASGAVASAAAASGSGSPFAASAVWPPRDAASGLGRGDGAPEGAAGGGWGEEGGGEEEEADDTWILLGAPWLEGYVAMQQQPPEQAAEGAAPTAGGPWRRVWCVLQDSAFAFFEHERAAATDGATPIQAVEWLHIRAITLAVEPAPPAAAPSTAAAPSVASGCIFTLQLSTGPPLRMRLESAHLRAIWVKELLRLAAWRAVHALQIARASDWQAVRVEEAAVGGSGGHGAPPASPKLGRAHAVPEAPLCSSPPQPHQSPLPPC